MRYAALFAAAAGALLLTGCSVKVVPVKNAHQSLYPGHSGVVTAAEGEAIYRADDYVAYEGAKMLKRSLHIREGEILLAYRYDNERHIYCKSPYCFLDSNGDGAFDHYARFDGIEHDGDFERTRRTHPYKRVTVERGDLEGYRRVIRYAGTEDGKMAVDYLEYRQEFAKPSLVERIEFSAETLPFVAKCRGIRFEVTTIDDTGVTYRILP